MNELNFVNPRREKASHVIRLLLPYGTYPNKNIISDDSFYYCDNDICFSIAPYENVENDDYYSEVEWARLSEIKLYASIQLSVTPDEGYLNFYPFRYPRYFFIDDFSDLINNTETVKKSLISEINKYPASDPRNIYQVYNESYMPTCCGGRQYQFREDGYDLSLQNKLFNTLDTTNHLLIRGLSTLIRSRMLSVHMHFMEEAINTTFIALEASFSLVLDRLKLKGIQNPTSEEAAQYIANVFHSETANKYFEEYYYSRIMSFHPKSRFGTFPHAPLMVDDHYHLYNDLSEVYCYLICGHVNEKYAN